MVAGRVDPFQHDDPATGALRFANAGHCAPYLLSAGAGLSMLGGLVRLDLARALRSPTGWKLHFYFNGVL